MVDLASIARPANPSAGTANLFNQALPGDFPLLRLQSSDGTVLAILPEWQGSNHAEFGPRYGTGFGLSNGNGAVWGRGASGGATFATGDPAAAAQVDQLPRMRINSGVGSFTSSGFLLNPVAVAELVVSRARGFFVEVVSAMRSAETAETVSVFGVYGGPIVPADVATSAPDKLVVGWRETDLDTPIRLFRRTGTGTAATPVDTGLVRDNDTLWRMRVFALAGAAEIGVEVTNLDTGDVYADSFTTDIPSTDRLVVECVLGAADTGLDVNHDVVCAVARWA